MAYVLSGVRRHQKTAMLALVAAGLGFNGNVEATLKVTDTKNLKFSADVKVFTGDLTTPSVTITPADDGGKVKVFTHVDNLITWLNGAFSGVADLKVFVPDMEDTAKPFVPPTDPVADATKRKTSAEKAKAAAQLRLASATSAVTAAEGLGWDEVTAHPALQAKYAALVLEKATVQGYVDSFTAEITRLTAIINA